MLRKTFLNRAAAMALATSFPVGAAMAASDTFSMPFSTPAFAEEKEKPTMYYRMLGNTGLQVSILSFGFWATYGSRDGLRDDSAITIAKSVLKAARQNGVNLFDNAEVYGIPRGEAERIMGAAIAELRAEDPDNWRRSDIIITTKIMWGGDGVNERGLSRKHCIEGLDASLKRLQEDYVDLVFCHRPDPLTPTETVVRAMTALVRSGKAHAWGTSEWSAQQITEAFFIAKLNGLEPPQFEQPEYNMIKRERFEQEYFPIYQQPYNIGTTIWSPLASGLLTGKYNNGIPEGTRAASSGYGWLAKRVDQWRAEGKLDIVDRLTTYAKENFGCTMAQLALAWCLKNENVSTVLMGASKPSQIEENCKALAVAAKMTQKHMDEINTILGNAPGDYLGYGSGHFRTIDKLPQA